MLQIELWINRYKLSNITISISLCVINSHTRIIIWSFLPKQWPKHPKRKCKWIVYCYFICWEYGMFDNWTITIDKIVGHQNANCCIWILWVPIIRRQQNFEFLRSKRPCEQHQVTQYLHGDESLRPIVSSLRVGRDNLSKCKVYLFTIKLMEWWYKIKSIYQSIFDDVPTAYT